MEEPPTTMQRACFELGIKCGALYHQFAGTPVSPRSAASLERAIAESIENQPYCVSAEVEIDRDRLSESLDPTHGYTEFTGTIFECEVTVDVEGSRATAELVRIEGYPELRITDLSS